METKELMDARELLRQQPGGKEALSVVEKSWEEECRGAGLYPQTLFHFTDKKGLLGILESNFRITYSLERIECITSKGESELPINREFGAPMVSFCDLRLSELRVHMRDYGNYGIGMSKKWAIEKGLNPVYYISSQAKLLEQYIESMSDMFGLMMSSDSDSLSAPYHRLLNFYRYLKNYDAPLYRRGGLVRKSHRFANEREWRFVPPIDDIATSFVAKDVMLDSEKKGAMNEKFLDSPLVFDPKHINYVIVRKDAERDEIIDHIENAKKKYPVDELVRLKSRILTAAQIRDDV